MKYISMGKKKFEQMDVETEVFLVSIIISIMVASIVVLIEYWQFIILPGLIAGAFNKKMKRGIYSGMIGVTLVWLSYMLYSFLTKNSYMILDEFAELIMGGAGYGWIIFMLVMIFALLFGALGGAIGSGFMILICHEDQDDNKEKFKKKTPA